MKNRLLIFVMLFSLFLMISTVSADELVFKGVSSDIEVQTEEKMAVNSVDGVSADLDKESEDVLPSADIVRESVDSTSNSTEVSSNAQAVTIQTPQYLSLQRLPINSIQPKTYFPVTAKRSSFL